MINEDLKQAVIRDIVLLNLVGVKVVLVHGGGPEIGELLKKTGISVPEMMDILARLLQKGFITETVKNYYIRKI